MFNSLVPSLADFTVLDFEIWVFIFVRISFMVGLMPLIGAPQFPIKAKVGLTFFLACLIYTVLPEITVALPSTMLGLVTLLMREIFIGVVMGFSGSILFMGLNMAGNLIDHSTGFTMIQSINPTTETNESVMGQLKFILFSVILLVTGSHLFFIQIMAESFQQIPLLDGVLDYGSISSVLLTMTSEAFVYGVKLSAPVLVPLLLNTAGLALIARIMPQVNVWLVGMPLKIMVGLVTMTFVLPLLWVVFQKQFDSIQFYQMSLVKIMAG